MLSIWIILSQDLSFQWSHMSHFVVHLTRHTTYYSTQWHLWFSIVHFFFVNVYIGISFLKFISPGDCFSPVSLCYPAPVSILTRYKQTAPVKNFNTILKWKCLLRILKTYMHISGWPANKLPMIILLFAELKKKKLALFVTNIKLAKEDNYVLWQGMNFLFWICMKYSFSSIQLHIYVCFIGYRSWLIKISFLFPI